MKKKQEREIDRKKKEIERAKADEGIDEMILLIAEKKGIRLDLAEVKQKLDPPLIDVCIDVREKRR